MKLVKPGLVSDIGKYDENQDCGVAITTTVSGAGGYPEIRLIAANDGMSTPPRGREAARIVSGIVQQVPGEILRRGVFADAGSTEVEHKRAVTEVITANTEQMFKALAEAADKDADPQVRDAGERYCTTLAAALHMREMLAVWWLGDSRVYRLRDGRLEKLTKDHGELAMETGKDDWEIQGTSGASAVTYFVSPDRQRCDSTDVPNLRFVDVKDGDVIVACTDGISNATYPWVLEAGLNYCLMMDLEPQALAERFVDLIKSNFRDNATVAIMFIGEPRPLGSLGLARLRHEAHRLRFDRALDRAIDEVYLNGSRKYGAEWSKTGPAYLSGRRDRLAMTLSECVQRLTQGHAGICLKCGRLGDADEEHCETRRHTGYAALLLDDEGRLLLARALDANTTYHLSNGDPGHSATDTILISDVTVAPDHGSITIEENWGRASLKIQDSNSDNGIFERVGCSTDPSSFYHHLRIGHHDLVVLRAGR